MSQEFPDLLRSRARVSPHSLALKVGPLKWSYRDLHERVASLSAVLLSRGVGKGARVALLMHPSEGYVTLLHAIARLGAVAVPLNHRQSAKELRAQLLDSAPSLVVHDASFERAAGRTDEGRPPGRVLASELMEESESVRRPVAGGAMDISAPHALVYTSGSSGTPKGVVLTVSNMVWNAVSVGTRVGASPADRWLLCMPLFHVG
ncbi:MAG TPA: AMP-binding protein, partial [Nitrososphaerales archaeon]|nr:AMP-binding protein [Nitrososphaerales archaeon]